MGAFYVYEHIRNDTGAVFYVGKGKGRRAWSFGRNTHWNNIVNKAGRSVRIVVADVDEELSLLAEIERIDQLGRLGIALSNKTKGGDGAALVGEAAERHRISVRAAHSRPEVKERHRIAVTASHANEHTKQKMRDAALARSDELKAIFRKGLIQSWLSPEKREARIASIRAASAQKSLKMDDSKKRIVCFDSGVVFPSLASAARWVCKNRGIDELKYKEVASTITAACSGRRPGAYGFTWHYA